MIPLELLPSALAEAEEAAAWYAERWPIYLHGTRRVLLVRFPYLVVYREEPARILVVAVAHARRRPGYGARGEAGRMMSAPAMITMSVESSARLHRRGFIDISALGR